MKKILTAAALTLAFPAAALAEETTTAAPTAKELATTACKQERAQVGKATYKLTYNSVGIAACVKKLAPAAEKAADNAAQTCRAERKADPAAFRTTYGTNRNGANAMGKCVSAAAKATVKEQTTDRVAASDTCSEARTADATAFGATWGTGKNAFGKCVSKTAKQLAAERRAEEEQQATAQA